jgi:hypothetical protein
VLLIGLHVYRVQYSHIVRTMALHASSTLFRHNYSESVGLCEGDMLARCVSAISEMKML